MMTYSVYSSTTIRKGRLTTSHLRETTDRKKMSMHRRSPGAEATHWLITRSRCSSDSFSFDTGNTWSKNFAHNAYIAGHPLIDPRLNRIPRTSVQDFMMRLSMR
jgi:hypothetical protein